MKKFLAEYNTYANGTTRFNGFWEICGDRLVNQYNGWHHYTPSENDKIYEVEKYEDLPFREYYISNNYKTGWLDRNGNFFGCDYQDHCFVAWYCFHKEEYELEDMGWVKISINVLDRKKLDYYHTGLHGLTEAQKKYLIDNGFDVRE